MLPVTIHRDQSLNNVLKKDELWKHVSALVARMLCIISSVFHSVWWFQPSISSLVWHACGSHFTRTESVPISSSCEPFSMTFELCQGCSVKRLFAGARCSRSKDPGSPTKQKNLQVAKSSRGVGNFIANRPSKRNTKINSNKQSKDLPKGFSKQCNVRRSDRHAKFP